MVVDTALDTSTSGVDVGYLYLPAFVATGDLSFYFHCFASGADVQWYLGQLSLEAAVLGADGQTGSWRELWLATDPRSRLTAELLFGRESESSATDATVRSNGTEEEEFPQLLPQFFPALYPLLLQRTPSTVVTGETLLLV